MENRKCVYFVEGACEKKLIEALKEKPSLIYPGQIKVHNVIQDRIPNSVLMNLSPGSRVVFVFDTDKEENEQLRKNIESVKALSSKVELLTVMQVLNFEDEIERSTDVSKAQEITKSEIISEFKSAVNKIKSVEFRRALSRHRLDLTKLWIKKPPKIFGFVKQQGDKVKVK